MKKFAVYTVICLLLLSVNHAKADLMLTAVDGDWSNPVGPGVSTVNTYNGVGVIYGNLLQDQIRWGNYPNGSDQSGLGFTGIVGAATSSTNIVLGSTFQIGQLAHFNNPIWEGTEINWADLTIELTFDTGVTESFLFTFGIDETPNNTGGSPGDDDIISFPSSYPAETFDISGVPYTLQLLGFGSDQFTLISEFYSPEGTTNDTLLWGRITPIPAPGAVLLGSIGIGFVGWLRRRRTI